jgi:hypothetical protein
MKQILCVEQITVPHDRFTNGLRNVIKWSVRGLAILMPVVSVIFLRQSGK